MKEIVASRIIRLIMPLFLESPNRSKSHKGLSSRLILKPGTSESRPRRSCRITSNWGQCRRKCSLSSKSLPQAQNGAIHLCDYEDIINPTNAYSLLALAAAANRAFALCSKAFIKLETISSSSESQKFYEELAMDIFTKHTPKDSHPNFIECPSCSSQIADWSVYCPNCDTKFAPCIASGRPLMEYQFWMCRTCKHKAYEDEISNHFACPLCHSQI